MNGLFYWSTDRATVGLVVRGGVVIDAPPYAHRWALGRTLAELPPAKESVFVTDENMPVGTDVEGVDWGDVSPESVAAWTPDDMGTKVAPSYPEYPGNPHNHRFTISLAPDKPPFIVVRGNTTEEITAAFNELEAGGVYANLAASWASLKAQGTIGAGLGPVTPVSPQAPPPGLPQAPQAPGTPPPFGPNVSVPSAPGYAGPPQQQQQSWAPQTPAGPGGGWGAGQAQNRSQEKPRPAGWLMVDVPYNDKERFKALRAQGTESGNYLRGKIQWGGKGVYWLEPSIAQWVAQQGFPVTQ
jgi:hypothetical protein